MRLLALAAGLAGAGAMAQFPEASQHYVQRLAGAVDELSVVVADFDRSAQSAGLTRDEALAELSGSTFLAARNADMTRTITRYEALSSDLTLLREAGPVERALLLPARLDTEIGRRALEDFHPALPLTASGAGFAGVGFLAGYGLLALVMAGAGRVMRRRPVAET
ncbi:DUF2937 family protein [Nioella ostreopsis]|uniref:DUF2937 family protein n=1 Tax=Nioella ostreopsis TaxID=2448479 RepID=UPI000FDAD704|nr:DUF2937 family protein [Nioella ostreopsis]